MASSNIVLKISEKQDAQADTSNADTSNAEPESKKIMSQNEKVSLYIEQLTEQQKIVLNIAKDHLATSFCIEKSLGYLNWLKCNGYN
jgi:hypothetical protein